MSFKGFQKSIVRAPQQLKVKFNIGEHTKDAVYTDAERRFDELEKETKKLHDESKKYFEAINGTRAPPPAVPLDFCGAINRCANTQNLLIPLCRHAKPPD